jgi:hypothetical protein
MKKYVTLVLLITACASYAHSQDLVIDDHTSSYTFNVPRIVVDMEGQHEHPGTQKQADYLNIEAPDLTHFTLTTDKPSKTLLLVLTRSTPDGAKSYVYTFSNVDSYLVVHHKRIEIYGSPAHLCLPAYAVN